jgi:hypothetical protein
MILNTIRTPGQVVKLCEGVRFEVNTVTGTSAIPIVSHNTTVIIVNMTMVIASYSKADLTCFPFLELLEPAMEYSGKFQTYDTSGSSAS